jgi:SAM-dependent methyltransferase
MRREKSPENMKIIWTVDGDETSWGDWAESMAEAPATPLMQELIERHKTNRPGLALDLGCGTGRAFLPLNQAGYRVIGVEPSWKGIQLSRQKVNAGRLEATPLQASAAQLPLEGGCIDFVFAMGILFHLNQRELASALKEIRRVLKQEGKALLHFLDGEDWRRSLAPEVHAEDAPYPSYRAVVTCFSSKEAIIGFIEETRLMVETMELRTNPTERGEQRNWLVRCRK